jgi:hypothetical protein
MGFWWVAPTLLVGDLPLTAGGCGNLVLTPPAVTQIFELSAQLSLVFANKRKFWKKS